MYCPNCGCETEKDAAFCSECGAQIVVPTSEEPAPQPVEPQPDPAPVAENPAPVQPAPVQPTQEIPGAYKPLSPWAYFGWQLLFLIPFVGFVLLIVMSFAPRNKNLKNFARSYWCGLLIVLGLVVIVAALAVVLGGGIDVLTRYLS